MPGPASIDFSAGRTGISPTDGTQGFAGLGDALQAIAQRRHAMAVVKLQQEQEKQMQAERLAQRAEQAQMEAEARAAEKANAQRQHIQDRWQAANTAASNHFAVGNTEAGLAILRSAGGSTPVVEAPVEGEGPVPAIEMFRANQTEGPPGPNDQKPPEQPPPTTEIRDPWGQLADVVDPLQQEIARRKLAMATVDKVNETVPEPYRGRVKAAGEGAALYSNDAKGRQAIGKDVAEAGIRAQEEAARDAAAKAKAAARRGGGGKGGFSQKQSLMVARAIKESDPLLKKKQDLFNAVRDGRNLLRQAKDALARGEDAKSAAMAFQAAITKVHAESGAAFGEQELTGFSQNGSAMSKLMQRAEQFARGASADQLANLDSLYSALETEYRNAAAKNADAVAAQQNLTDEGRADPRFAEYARNQYLIAVGVGAPSGGSAKSNIPPKPPGEGWVRGNSKSKGAGWVNKALGRFVADGGK